jgi:C-terminal processing protease CtpA/Prc
MLDPVVAELADKIEELYVFPEAGKRIAEELRVRPRTAEDPEAFAADVKQFLRGYDAHLSLLWLPARANAEGPARPDLNDPHYQRRVNYGFRQAGLAQESIGLIDLTLFRDAASPHVRAAATAATSLVAHTDAMIIDLRDVPGGWPSGCNLLLGHFLPDQPTLLLTMIERGQANGQEDWTTPGNELGHRPDVPLFVLVDARTASAAEAFAYIMQSLGRATVIGQPTAGAANPGDFFPIGDEFTAFIPTMAPIDPRTGTNWEGIGVQPDIITTPADTLSIAIDLARKAIAYS